MTSSDSPTPSGAATASDAATSPSATPSSAPAPAPRIGPPDDGKGRRTPTWLSRGLVVLAASSTLVWIGAIIYGTANPDLRPVGYLEDRRFPKAAEPVCKKAMEDVAAFPPARESKSPAERADVIDASTARLRTMLEDLRGLVPDGPDARWINEWIDDWGTHLDDRLDFAERLRAKGAEEEFFESTKNNTQVSKSLNNYAEINVMESCSTPGDV